MEKQRQGADASFARRWAALAVGVFSASFLVAPVPSPRAAELLMFEQRACPFCDAFKAEIAPDYPRSRAGALAPLRRIDIFESRTGGVAGLDPAVFTPTFVLVDGDREIGRLLGYPGRKYFYPEIERLLAPLMARAAGTAPRPVTSGGDVGSAGNAGVSGASAAGASPASAAPAQR